MRFITALFCAGLLLIALAPGVMAASTLTVGAGQTYTTIQSAINAAADGDTVIVQSGTYVERVVVNRPITLTGVDTGGGMPVVDGTRLVPITIGADGVTVQGFNMTNGSCGIYVNSYHNNIITGNRVNDAVGDGIRLWSSNNNVVTGNARPISF